MKPLGIAIGAAAGTLALAAALWAVTPRGPQAASVAAPGAPAAGSLEAQIADLRRALAAERDERLGLAAEVDLLRQLMGSGAGLLFDTAPSPPPRAPAAAAPEAAGGAAASSDADWFDTSGLLAAGVPASDVTDLERLFEESELAVLQLRDRATREGWVDAPRFAQELYALRVGLRESVGDETFDRLLYATQRNNRVVVRSLLSTGPAARAGMRSGDTILRYDGRTIFRAGELQRATSQGEAGRPVHIDVKGSDGAPRSLTLPSGPLGVRLGEERQPPASSR